MKSGLRRLLLLASAFFLLSAAAEAQGLCVPKAPNCPFSVNGKKGPYLTKQFNVKSLDTAHDVLQAKSGESKGFGEHSINKGEFAASGLRMPETEKSVGELLARLHAKWPYPDHDPGPVGVRMAGLTIFAPSAQPDGYIVVPIGLIERAQSDDEVAWIMAHEYSHICLGHFARSAELAQRKQMLSNLVTDFAIGVEISQVRARKTGQGLQFYSDDDMAAKRKADLSWQRGQDLRQLLNVTTQIVSREQEDQADAAGLDLAIAAGYAADEGSAHALTVLSEDDAKIAAAMKGYQQEVQDMAKLSMTPEAAAAFKSGNITGGLTAYMKEFGANMAQSFAEKGIAYLSQSHRSTPARRKGINAYLQTAHKDDPVIDTTTAWLDRVKSTAEFRDAWTAVDAHDLAEAARAQDPKKALELLQPALATRFAHTPLIANEAAGIEDDLGDQAEADRLYDEAEGVARPHPVVHVAAPPLRTRPRPGAVKSGGSKASSPSASKPAETETPRGFNGQDVGGYKNHVDLLIRMNSLAKAQRKITEAEGLLGDHEAFLPALITLSYKNNKVDDAIRYLQECSDTQDEAQIINCRYAALDPESRKKIESLSPAERARFDQTLAKNDDRLTQKAGFKNFTTAISAPAGQPTPAAGSTTKH